MLDEVTPMTVDGRDYIVIDLEDCDVYVVDVSEMQVAYVGGRYEFTVDDNAPHPDNGYYECSICGQEFAANADERTGKRTLVPCVHMRVAFDYFEEQREEYQP